MNVGIETQAAQFLFREHINWIFGTVWAETNNPHPEEEKNRRSGSGGW